MCACPNTGVQYSRIIKSTAYLLNWSRIDILRLTFSCLEIFAPIDASWGNIYPQSPLLLPFPNHDEYKYEIWWIYLKYGILVTFVSLLEHRKLEFCSLAM